MRNIESFEELITLSKGKSTADVFLEVESSATEIDVEILKKHMESHLGDMKQSIYKGLSSSIPSASGMSGEDSVKLAQSHETGRQSFLNPLLSRILCYSIAVMEENQRMGKIVACPTAGSCGIVPSVIIAVAEEYEYSKDVQVKALFTAGGIGKLIAQKVALAGAVAGCQAECGTASAMAAAALVEMAGGDIDAQLNATALALKNTLGLVCDPVAGLVEVPCIKRNGFLAISAVTAAEMALAGVKSVIPADEVVKAMKQIGDLMSPLLKESSEAGLATTATGLQITEKLQKIWNTEQF